VPQIRIDDDVWAWLQSHAEPLVDTPNAVLRRVAGLDQKRNDGANGMSKRSNTGKALNREWGVGARDAKYHVDGTFFEHLRAFPGALFDGSGYVEFKTEADYRSAPGLDHGQKLNVHGGICNMPGYVHKS
jgi:hypothetical protein